tara:strand:- start:874 stop:1470 length:597 start_codon:yes stop_codon:yes gene_type:complete
MEKIPYTGITSASAHSNCAKKLDTKLHLQNSNVLSCRDEQLQYIQKDSICMEIGVYKGDFSEKILEKNPKKLYLIEINSEYCENLKIKFKKFIDNNIVEIINKDSLTALKNFEKESLDYIYIDAGHEYVDVFNDLEESHKILKYSGLIGLNDYIFYDYLMPLRYGVMQAAHEFIIKYNYNLIAFCLEPHGFHDILIKK